MSVLQNNVNRPRYVHIVNKWISLRKQYDYAKTSEPIAHDYAFGLEIIDFLLDSLVMTKEQPSAVARELFEFASLFFYGGEHDNDNNYLDFDEVSIFDKINTKNFEKVTKKQIETMIKALELGRKRLLRAQKSESKNE